MMANWSPFTRRALALTILAFVVLGIANFVIVPVVGTISSAINELQDSRFRVARLEAIEGRPAVPNVQPVPSGLTIAATNRGAAGSLMAGALGAAATRTQVTLDPPTVLPQDNQPRQVAISVGVVGSEAAVLSFVNALEAGQPLVRFRNWRFAVVDGPPRQLRFEGVALAPWSDGR
jgi:hypothetical protein